MKTQDGTIYTSLVPENLSINDVAFSIYYMPMTVMMNQSTQEREVVCTNTIVAFSFADGLTDEDVETLTKGNPSQDNEDGDIDYNLLLKNFKSNGGMH